MSDPTSGTTLIWEIYIFFELQTKPYKISEQRIIKKDYT